MAFSSKATSFDAHLAFILRLKGKCMGKFTIARLEYGRYSPIGDCDITTKSFIVLRSLHSVFKTLTL